MILSLFSVLILFLFLLVLHILSDFIVIFLASVPFASSTCDSLAADVVLGIAQLILYACV